MDEQKITPQDPEQPADGPKSVSAFQSARELAAKEQRAAELSERKWQAEENERQYQAREEYAKEISEDKIALMKLRQGLLTEDDEHFKDDTPQKKYTVWQKIGNWFYHAKWWLGIGTFCALLVGFLIFDMITRVDPDLRILMLSSNYELYSSSTALCDKLAEGCPDFNDDGKSVVSSVYIPVTQQNLETANSAGTAYNTQLSVQLGCSMCMLVLADQQTDECVPPEEAYVNLEELYPQYDFIEGCRVPLNDTKFIEQFGLTNPLHEGTYLALRVPTENLDDAETVQKNYDNARIMLEWVLETMAKEETAP